MAEIDINQIVHYQNKLRYEIDAWDLYQALRDKGDMVVVDARSEEAYQREHILHAINFPHRTINQETAAQKLNFSTLYVTYCDGIGCNASTKGALKLAQLGYKVKELIGGIEWWKRDQYPVMSINSCSVSTVESECGCGPE